MQDGRRLLSLRMESFCLALNIIRLDEKAIDNIIIRFSKYKKYKSLSA